MGEEGGRGESERGTAGIGSSRNGLSVCIESSEKEGRDGDDFGRVGSCTLDELATGGGVTSRTLLLVAGDFDFACTGVCGAEEGGLRERTRETGALNFGRDGVFEREEAGV